MASKSRAQNTLFNTAAGMAAKIATIISGFVLRSLFIRLLGLEYAGVSTLFTDILSALSVAELGISTAITYAMYKPVADKDDRKIAALMDFYKKAYRLVALVILTVGIALIPALPYLVKDVPNIRENITLIYVLYVVNSAVSYLLIYRGTLLTAHQEHRFVSYVQGAAQLVKIGVLCVILLVFRNFIAYLIAEIIITRSQNVIISYIAKKRYPEACKEPEEKLSKEERKALLKDVRALMLYKICNNLLRSVDSIITSAMFGTVWVGLMGNYASVTKRVNAVINQFYDSASPSIGNLSVESPAEKKYDAFRVLHFMAFWMCCFSVTSFITLFNPFIDLWLGTRKDGSSYALCMPFVIVLCFNFYINSTIHPVTTFRTTNGLFVQGKYRPLVMLILNAGLSVLFAWQWGKDDPQMGLFGVKFATAVAQILTIQWFDPWLVYKNVFKRSVSEYFRSVLMRLFITASCCASTYGLAALLDASLPGLNRFANFGIKMVMCVIIPNVVIILLYRKRYEYKEFMRILKRLCGKKFHKQKAANA